MASVLSAILKRRKSDDKESIQFAPTPKPNTLKRKSLSAPLNSLNRQGGISLDEQFNSELNKEKITKRRESTKNRLSIKITENVESFMIKLDILKNSNGKTTMKEIASEQNLPPEIFYVNFDYNYDKAMKNKKLKKAFSVFLEESHNDELFKCKEEIEKYMTIKTPRERYKRAMEMFSLFIVPFSESEINISNETRRDITQKIDVCSPSDCPIDLFSAIEKIVNLSLQIDCFKRYVQDRSFRSFCDNLDKESFDQFSTVIDIMKDK
eukprot:gene34-4285_t